ncbi:MAG: DUF4344 domain-containing metallopeptidase [Actinomycetota bacterium]
MRHTALGLLFLLTFTACSSASTDEGLTADNGTSFLLAYEHPQDENEEALKAFLQDSNAFEDLLAALEEALDLDTPISIVVGAEDGPLFDPSINEIWYPYWFIDYLAQPFADGEDFQESTLGAARFILVHEIGHALIEALEIPVLGKEEDAVDTLGAVVMTELFEDGAADAIATAEWFAWAADQRELDETDFMDEHSLDLQRAYSILCRIAGSDEEVYLEVEEAELLAIERLERCPAEYEAARDSWETLLSEVLQDPSPAEPSDG